jgi:hypothetical protein
MEEQSIKDHLASFRLSLSRFLESDSNEMERSCCQIFDLVADRWPLLLFLATMVGSPLILLILFFFFVFQLSRMLSPLPALVSPLR